MLSPNSFDWAKSFLASKTWEALISCSKDVIMMPFAIPITCPKDAEVHCLSSNYSGNADGNPNPDNIIMELDIPNDSPPRAQPITNIEGSFVSP